MGTIEALCKMKHFGVGVEIVRQFGVGVGHKLKLEQCSQKEGLVSALCKTCSVATARSLLVQPAPNFQPFWYQHHCQP